MISPELIEENKNKLLQEKERLENMLKKIANPNPDVEGDYEAKYPDMGDDADENATEVAEFATNIAEEGEIEERLKKINLALERIEKGTYGIDVNTGEEISEDRLRAVPEADSNISHDRIE